MWTIVAILLIIWLGISILGFLIEGLFWLAVIGIILFLVTGAIGWVRGRARKQ